MDINPKSAVASVRFGALHATAVICSNSANLITSETGDPRPQPPANGSGRSWAVVCAQSEISLWVEKKVHNLRGFALSRRSFNSDPRRGDDANNADRPTRGGLTPDRA
jgi:hypothetical protein